MKTGARSDELRWAAVVARDSAADGTFYYSVASTGVYCRPSCPSRLARRKNVGFHASCEAAERAGFRACKRCRPKEPSLSQRNAKLVERACRLIESAEPTPDLAMLAKSLALSPYHFHRIFKTLTGLTPKGYAGACRASRVRNTLPTSKTVTRALYDAGFRSHGQFYAAAVGFLGMTPSRYRAGGADTEIRFAIGECSLGSILVGATTKGVCAIFLGEDPQTVLNELQRRFAHAELLGGDADFEKLVSRVIEFVDRAHLGLDFPLDVRRTAFQQRVWQTLSETGVGETMSYADLAKRIGGPKAVRAVAKACAANAVAVAIPCIASSTRTAVFPATAAGSPASERC